MSSFATNAVCAQPTLCTQETIEEAVDTLNEALLDSASERPEGPGNCVKEQMKLELVWVKKQANGMEASS